LFALCGCTAILGIPDISLRSEDGGGGVDSSADAGGGVDSSADAGGGDDSPAESGADAQPNGCPPLEKECSGICVAVHDPATGCALASCAPCNLPHATPTCSNTGACDIDTCAPGYDDCNMDPSDGCETNLATDPMNCSACDMACAAGVTCVNSVCQ
jgi:hypothetical protein